MPVITFGYYRILTSMYTTFNTVFLGFSGGDVEVGYFATATKLYAIIMSVFTAFTTVMVPKVSELVQEENIEKLQWIADQTISKYMFSPDAITFGFSARLMLYHSSYAE